MYRLDVFSPWRGWVPLALGRSFRALNDYGFSLLRPSGRFERYRVRRARKADLEALRLGVFQSDGSIYKRCI